MGPRASSSTPAARSSRRAGPTRARPRSISASHAPADPEGAPVVTQEREGTVRRRVRDNPAWLPRPTLSGKDYSSVEVFEEEREHLFFRGWVCVGRSDEVPAAGDYLVRDVVGESVF